MRARVDGMTKMKWSSKILVMVAMVAAISWPAATQDLRAPEVYSAVALGTGGSVGGKSISFNVRITSYTTDAEVQQFAELVKAKGQDALRSALEKQDKGRVLPTGSTGNAIAVARKRREGANTIITIVTARLMSFNELYRNGRSTDYPFGYLQFTLNENGVGSGKIMAAAQIKFDKKKQQYVIESFGNQYLKATNVRVQK